MKGKISNFIDNKVANKGKELIQKSKKARIIGLTALTLSGAMTSCNGPSDDSNNNQKTNTEKTIKEVGSTKTSNNNKKNNVEKTREVFDAEKQAYRSWDVSQNAQTICEKAAKNGLKKYNPEYHTVFTSISGNMDSRPRKYTLPAITIGGKDISLVAYAERGVFLRDGNSMIVTIKDGNDSIVGTIHFGLVQYANTIRLEKIGLTVNVNGVTLVDEKPSSCLDTKSKFKNKEAERYLVYFNDRAEELVRAYPKIIQKEFFQEKPKIDSIKKETKHRQDSTRLAVALKKQAAKEALESKIRKESQKNRSRK